MKAALIAAVALAAVLLAYGDTLAFGFRYDDYHVLRPSTSAELLQAAHGNWDATGIESRFYRPLTAYWYALRFSLFGLNAAAQHAISLTGSALCAFLAGLFVWREVRRLFPAMLTAGLYAILPAFVYAQAIWLTNQMHLFSSVLVLLAFLVWQRARERGGRAWWWLIALQAAAFGFKEDTIMLLPAIALLTLVRARLVRDVRRPSPGMIAAAVAILVALPYLRFVALGRHLGGYGRPPFEQGWSNLLRILDFVLQRPAKRPWQAFAGTYAAIASIAALAAAAISRRAAALYLLVCGVCVALAFNLPFYLVSKAEQYHLVALGIVLMLAGAVDALQQLVRGRARIAVATLATVPAFAYYPVTRSLVQDFAPCSPNTLYTDAIVQQWAVVPYEIRGWLHDKPDRCRTGTLMPLTSLPVVVWAGGRETDETGAPVEWTRDSALIMLSRDVTRANITVRTPIASVDTPSIVRLQTSVGSSEMRLTDPEWHTQTVRLSPGFRTRMSGMARLTVHVTPTFVPNERFQNGDRRVLGVLMKVPQQPPM